MNFSESVLGKQFFHPSAPHDGSPVGGSSHGSRNTAPLVSLVAFQGLTVSSEEPQIKPWRQQLQTRPPPRLVIPTNLVLERKTASNRHKSCRKPDGAPFLEHSPQKPLEKQDSSRGP